MLGLVAALVFAQQGPGQVGQTPGITKSQANIRYTRASYAGFAMGQGQRYWMPQIPAASAGNTVYTGRLNVGNVGPIANPLGLLRNTNAVTDGNGVWTDYDSSAASSVTYTGAWEVPVAGPFTVSSATNSGAAVITFSGSPGWTTNQFVATLPSNSVAGYTYSLGKITGASDYVQEITANTNSTITCASVYGTAPTNGDVLYVYRLYQMTWSNATSVTLTSGQSVWTDPAKFVAPYGGTVGEQLYYRLSVTVPTSGTVFDQINPSTLEAGYSGADRTFYTSGTLGSARIPYNTGNVPFFRLVTALDLSRTGQKQSPIALIGDSITLGTNGAAANIFTTGRSATQRALYNAGVPFFNLGSSGESASWAAGHYAYRIADAVSAGCTRAIICYGRNDITASLGTPQTAAQIEGNLTTLANLCHTNGIKFCWQTLPPYTTSSDSWATSTNQTVSANEATRLAVNTWMRSGAGSALADYSIIELDNAVNVIRTSDGAEVWSPNWTAEGTHPSELCIEAIEYSLDLSGILSTPPVVALARNNYAFAH
jgi:hypothetical protein